MSDHPSYTQHQGIDPLVAELREYRQAGSVLALGAGSNALWLADHAFTVTAVEESGRLIDQAQKLQLPMSFVRMPVAEFIPAAADRFDVVVSVCALHLMPIGRLRELVVRLKHQTTPGGLHVIKALGEQTPRATVNTKTSLVPWLQWYGDWRIIRYEYRDDEQPTKFAESAHWLYDHTTILIAQQVPASKRRSAKGILERMAPATG